MTKDEMEKLIDKTADGVLVAIDIMRQVVSNNPQAAIAATSMLLPSIKAKLIETGRTELKLDEEDAEAYAMNILARVEEKDAERNRLRDDPAAGHA